MVNFLDNDDSIIKEELMTYYHFRANLIKHINDRMDHLGEIHNKGTEYDYCKAEGQLAELQLLLEFIKYTGRNTMITKQIESTEIKNQKEN
jgi:hypothetical protein